MYILKDAWHKTYRNLALWTLYLTSCQEGLLEPSSLPGRIMVSKINLMICTQVALKDNPREHFQNPDSCIFFLNNWSEISDGPGYPYFKQLKWLWQLPSWESTVLECINTFSTILWIQTRFILLFFLCVIKFNISSFLF